MGLRPGATLRLCAAAFFIAATLSASAAQWQSLGPDGGDVRSLAYDPRNPNRIYLGTSAGALFTSDDSGASWTRLARLGAGEDYVLDHIIIDPQDGAIFIAAWSVETNGGDLFRSDDAGRSWKPVTAMHGKSIRALAMARSDRRVLVAGALDGVYRSRDRGQTWEQISPASYAELKNIESIAIDPVDPNVIYAGTWHLPWKTDDDGRSWSSIKQGIIDDSDVFSIIVDPTRPGVVYASACSGIYKSENGGGRFRKVQGIPFSARRTRVLQQDPGNRDVVYAGTTEGLWRTSDAGATWKRISAANLIVNDVLVDPRNPSRVLIATDRSGVLASSDGGRTFAASNRGFAHRQVAAIVADSSDPRLLYAGLVNDKEFGGVFMSRDAGQTWEQKSIGLGDRDVFTLRQLSSGELIAGSNRGVFALAPGSAAWRPLNDVLGETTKLVRLKNGKQRTIRAIKHSELNSRVYDFEISGINLFAATSGGLFTSADAGRSWHGGPLQGEREFISVRAAGPLVAAATARAVLVSLDGGVTWQRAPLPDFVTTVSSVAVLPGSLWLATREGAMRSGDAGRTWEHVLAGLPHHRLASIAWDEDARRLLATAFGSSDVFESTDLGRSWRRKPAGFSVRNVFSVRGRLIAITAFDGIVAQPETEATPKAASAGGSQE